MYYYNTFGQTMFNQFLVHLHPKFIHPEFYLLQTTMKNITLVFILSIIATAFTACHTTEEATQENRPTTLQMQTFQQQQERRETAVQRTGLTADEIGILDDYAKRKSVLECQMIELDKSAGQALSPAAEQEIKEALIVLDNQLTPLGQEIDRYCDTETKQRYFFQTHRRYLENCKKK